MQKVMPCGALHTLGVRINNSGCSNLTHKRMQAIDPEMIKIRRPHSKRERLLMERTKRLEKVPGIGWVKLPFRGTEDLGWDVLPECISHAIDKELGG